MNRVEQLLTLDVEQLKQKKKAIFFSKRLGELLGMDKPFEVEIQELSQRRVTKFMGEMQNSKGNIDIEKTVKAKTHIVAEGVSDPQMNDPALKDKFGDLIPTDMSSLLFGPEITKIANAILAISGVDMDDEDDDKGYEEIKNS